MQAANRQMGDWRMAASGTRAAVRDWQVDMHGRCRVLQRIGQPYRIRASYSLWSLLFEFYVTPSGRVPTLPPTHYNAALPPSRPTWSRLVIILHGGYPVCLWC